MIPRNIADDPRILSAERLIYEAKRGDARGSPDASRLWRRASELLEQVGREQTGTVAVDLLLRAVQCRDRAAPPPQTCDQTCGWCAANYWRWVKGRLRSQDRPSGRSGAGSWNDAAATSIIGDGPDVSS